MPWSEIIISVAIFLGILALALVIRITLFKILQRLAKKTKVPWDEIVIDYIKRLIPLWAILLALHLSISISPIPPQFLKVINKALLIIFVISLAVGGANLVVRLVDLFLLQKTGVPTRVTLIEIFIKALIYSIALISILHILDINIAPFVTTLGIAGLAIGLALKDTLENFFSGIHILMARQIKPGDFIRLESGEEGIVKDINWRTTSILTQQNNLVIIPNAKLAQSKILNYTLPEEELSLLFQIGISYESDLEQVERITLEVAKELMQTHPLGVPDFEPLVRFHSFGDHSINFNVILRCKNAENRFKLIHDFIKTLYKRYQIEGIKIPYPIRTVYLHSVDTTHT
ncbi:MAG: mechanosensitive ion channel family protein [Caldimicrobium sp.]|nr:mechanosensitive ion channel family protein [Caldimicrobium sp.]MCX7873584.1 mechanosensitive ion channel family protein [Caldimicrobium sp.]MDW8094031.1 mechanosensitive ion channel family protein [Caldimicrobium sp.]